MGMRLRTLTKVGIEVMYPDNGTGFSLGTFGCGKFNYLRALFGLNPAAVTNLAFHLKFQ